MNTHRTPKTIHLVRHAESLYNESKAKRLEVSSDYSIVNDDPSLFDCSLTSKGFQQAKVRK